MAVQVDVVYVAGGSYARPTDFGRHMTTVTPSRSHKLMASPCNSAKAL